MRTLVIDNESEIRNSLIELITAFCPEVTKISSADSVMAGIEKIKIFKPDVVFLDVELGDGTGMDLLSKIENINFQVIFITAHNKYAVDAFKFSAIDFLLKPINPEELVIAVNKVKDKIKHNDILQQLTILSQNYALTFAAENKIVLKDAESIYFVKTKEIIRCESEGAYTTFYLVNNEKIVISKTIKEYEELLKPYGFLRTHQSHLVNKACIKRFDKSEGGILILDNNDSVPVSQRKKEHIIEMLKKG